MPLGMCYQAIKVRDQSLLDLGKRRASQKWDASATGRRIVPSISSRGINKLVTELSDDEIMVLWAFLRNSPDEQIMRFMTR
jgi:hypothetical protein